MHTPGPWQSDEDGWYVRPIGVLQAVASVCGLGITRKQEVADNARLIAAAPDLLAACERSLLYLTWKDMLGDENRVASLLDTLDMLRAAIDKAEGK